MPCISQLASSETRGALMPPPSSLPSPLASSLTSSPPNSGRSLCPRPPERARRPPRTPARDLAPVRAAVTDLLRVLPHWPKDSHLELAPLNFAATRARLVPEELEAELGLITVPRAA